MKVPLTFRLLPWERSDSQTVDPLGLYAEMFWLPILHPTSYLLGRLLVRTTTLEKYAGEVDVMDATEIGHALGVVDRSSIEQGGTGLRIYFGAAQRLARYRLVRWDEDSCEVLLRWPRLTEGLLYALHENLRQAEPILWSAASTPAEA